ncbi:hypothetical protein BV20DRAFT_472007 [Pilatotrama ljubarskyi]|nr:hypothetical protein BV20DRAFT_472007 [Pilatotrama ljubarskyi]
MHLHPPPRSRAQDALQHALCSLDDFLGTHDRSRCRRRLSRPVPVADARPPAARTKKRKASRRPSSYFFASRTHGLTIYFLMYLTTSDG